MKKYKQVRREFRIPGVEGFRFVLTNDRDSGSVWVKYCCDYYANDYSALNIGAVENGTIAALGFPLEPTEDVDVDVVEVEEVPL